jgi:protein subunit release factor B
MAVLQSRVDQLEMARQAQMNAQHTQSLTDITWGSQIRSYVLHVCSGVWNLTSFINLFGTIDHLSTTNFH